MSYIESVASGFSNFLNAVAGGNPDVSISARTGYLAEKISLDYRWYWLLVRYFIDLIFLPIEGPGHCRRAYLNDQTERFKKGGQARLAVFCALIIIFSIPLIALTNVYAGFTRLFRGFKDD